MHISRIIILPLILVASTTCGGQKLAAKTTTPPVDIPPEADEAHNDDPPEDTAPRCPDWPVLSSVAPFSSPILPTLDEPGYLSWSTDPRTAPPNLAGNLRSSEVTRVTDADVFGYPNAQAMRHNYSKVGPWNADDSLAMVYTDTDGPSRPVILDGETFAFKRVMTVGSVNGRWSNVEPEIYFVMQVSPPQLLAMNVLDDSVSVVHDFTADGYVKSGAQLFGGEGNQSNDDRVWVFNLQRPNGDWELLIWDKPHAIALGTIPTPFKAGSRTAMDTWTVSKGGEFIVTKSPDPWVYNGETIPLGISVWSLAGDYLRTSPNGGGHFDVCFDTEGNEVLAYIRPIGDTNEKIGQTWRLDGSEAESVVQFADGYIGWSYHLSCTNTLRPGWMVVTSTPSPTPWSYDKFPMWNHIFAVRLDGSGEIAVIGNSHHANAPDNVYKLQSHGAANRNLTAVMFAGWDGDDSPVHAYVTRCEE